jgi:hypothetical protein
VFPKTGGELAVNRFFSALVSAFWGGIVKGAPAPKQKMTDGSTPETRNDTM